MNRLAACKSPYLLQHAENPVDWYPWGDEAFRRAKEKDKPVFLSIGYSACHWCHVMARESFEDPEVAEVLNRNYVAVKVDREERPDIDNVYQAVCMGLTGQGGWPLTVITTPDKRPFFAGTYFPKTARYGRPGLLELLKEIARRWTQDRDGILDIAENIMNSIRQAARPRGAESVLGRGAEAARALGAEAARAWGGEELSAADLSEAAFHEAYQELETAFDERHGGFGHAPKFPAPANLSFLLRYHRVTGESRALSMVEKTLVAMRRGGIYDQVGFGFHRYSTDRKWLVPHFEKMLYDNALLALAYLEAYQATGKEFYARVAREVFTYLARDMRAPDGGFAASQDADSEGKEGKFYTWTPDEVREVLGEEDADLFCRYFGITSEGNFETGRSIPNLLASEAGNLEIAGGSGHMDGDGVEERLARARERLLNARARRVHPGRDDKVLTAWNGLAVAALARGGRVLAEASYAEAAARTVDFILETLRRPDGRLLARYREGEGKFPAYLDDYAFLIWGLIEVWEATFEAAYLRVALDLARAQLDLFWDRERGGFFFTGADAEELLVRTKDAQDGALPSGNSVSAHNLLRLASLTGEEEWREKVHALFQAFSGEVAAHPSGFPFLLTAWKLSETPPTEVVIAGSWEREDTRRLWDVVRGRFMPEAVILHNPGGDRGKALSALLPALTGKDAAADGHALAYVCKGLSCQEPVADPMKLERLL
ncbi:MAG: thioredoxin domain-containing protein [Firmicutes bacterium]|nr:thioredoxin domain-containing protein [Bacillota bacterium]MDH7496192.1 thioredoxin domain-containing protein [Bacillota bacterium]